MGAREIETTRPVTRYLIAGYKRSGTTLSHLLLKGHPGVSALNDEMTIAPFFERGIEAYTIGGYLTGAERDLGSRRLFDAIAGANFPEADAYGAKIAVGSPRAARSVVECIRKHMPGMKIILIRRSDLAAQFGSLLQRRRTGIAHSWNPGRKEGQVDRIRINKILFARYVAGVLDAHDQLERARDTNDVLDVSYEDLSRNMDGVYRQMLSFLELPYVEPAWLDSRKVLPRPAEYISNYQEIVSLQSRILEAHRNGTISRPWRKAVGLYCRGHGLLMAPFQRH